MFQSYISHLFSQESSNFKFLGELSEWEGAKFKLLEKLRIYNFLSFLFPQISGSSPKLDPAPSISEISWKKHQKYKRKKNRTVKGRWTRITINIAVDKIAKLQLRDPPWLVPILVKLAGKDTTSISIRTMKWSNLKKWKSPHRANCTWLVRVLVKLAENLVPPPQEVKSPHRKEASSKYTNFAEHQENSDTSNHFFCLYQRRSKLS